MGCLKLTYPDYNTELKIVHRKDILTSKNTTEKAYSNQVFGMKMRGFNEVVSANGNSLGQKEKTFQGQRLDDDLGLNWHAFKYRNYDAAIARFFNIDPLAEEYTYNSTYAFQENKLGLGIELEGLELFERIKNGVTQFLTGADDLAQKNVKNNIKAKFENAKTSKPNAIENSKHEKLMDTSKALGNMGEGVIEATKGTAQVAGTVLEVSGDAVSTVGVYTAQPEVVIAGEAMSGVGAGVNALVDYSDGKPLSTIGTEAAVKQVFGTASSQGIKATRKVAGDKYVKAGKNVISESIIHSVVKLKETILTPIIVPAIENKIVLPIMGPVNQQ